MIAALFVEKGGCYFGLNDVDPWDEARDARLYAGPHPVVAHPPCQRFGNMGLANYARWGGDHNRPGNDGGCFSAALDAVYKFGGVLEHPAYSHAWELYGLPRPVAGLWTPDESTPNGWSTQVSQSAYGHMARKRTWLYCVIRHPPILDWRDLPGTHQCGFQDGRGKARNKPTLSKKDSNATPIPFRDLLISIAASARD
jgi:hypothetical protein